ncbi:MAG: trigger factor family protein [Microscillaceae bacterium]|nr:trigger factor family protein [Microscillaceae bacterium]MDW8461334.1 trigger factor family protein [Cytophagales bacterium]
MITEYFSHDQDELVSVIRVVVEEADSQEAVNQTLKKYARQAQIKGFRPGHAPAQLIKKIYGKYIIEEETAKIASQAVTKFLEEQKWETVGFPIRATEYEKKSSFKSEADREFWFKVGLVNIGEINFTQLPNNLYDIVLSDKDVDKILDTFYETQKKDVEVEVITKGDMVLGFLSPVEEEEKAKFEKYWQEAKKQEKNENQAKTESEQEDNAQDRAELFVAIPTEKISQNILTLFEGKDNQSTIYFDIQQLFQENQYLKYLLGFTEEQIQTLQGQYQLKVKKIIRLQLPEKTPEFFHKVIESNNIRVEKPIENEEQLREFAIQKSTEANKEAAKKFLGLEIKKYLIENTQVEFSKDFLIDFLVEINSNQSTSIDRNSIANELEKSIKSYKWQFIRRHLERKFNLPPISNEEIVLKLYKDLYNLYSLYLSENNSAKAIQEIISEQVREIIHNPKNNPHYEKMKEDAYSTLAEEKLLNYIIEHKITIVPVPITAAEYNEIIKKRQLQPEVNLAEKEETETETQSKQSLTEEVKLAGK